jgi:hypothetical protein
MLSTERLTDNFLNRHEYALVYYPRGSMSHLMRMCDVNGSRLGTPICERVPFWHTPLGTGTQDEWETARARGLCVRCEERVRWLLERWEVKQHRA